MSAGFILNATGPGGSTGNEIEDLGRSLKAAQPERHFTQGFHQDPFANPYKPVRRESGTAGSMVSAKGGNPLAANTIPDRSRTRSAANGVRRSTSPLEVPVRPKVAGIERGGDDGKFLRFSERFGAQGVRAAKPRDTTAGLGSACGGCGDCLKLE